MNSIPEDIESLIKDKSIDDTNSSENIEKSASNITRKAVILDNGFQKHFLNPMLSKLEDTVAKNLRTLDEMEEGNTVQIILKRLDKILSKVNLDNEYNQNRRHVNDSESMNKNESSETSENNLSSNIENLSKLDRLNEIICLASSINAYLNTLNNRFIKNNKIDLIANEIYSNVNMWLSRLFRFHNSNILFHQNDYESIVHIVNLIIHIKYDNIDTEGYKVLLDREPVFYVSSASKYSKLEYRQKICNLLGLPIGCMKIINVCNKIGLSFDKINLNEFVEQIEKDISENKLPQLVIANAGSHNVGQCDNIPELANICNKYKIWLHLDGIHLSTLVLYSVPTAIQPVNSGDSISLDFGNWIGVPSLSFVTLYKEIEDSRKLMQLYQDNWRCLDKSLPYWCLLQAIGHEGVVERIKYASNLSKYLVNTIQKQQLFLKLITFKEKPEGSEVSSTSRKYTLQELIATAINFLALVELNNSIVIFKCNDNYIKEILIKHNSNLTYDFNEIENHKLFNDYCNALTCWLCDLLNSIHKSVRLDVISIEDEGICIRYSPIEHVNVLQTTEEDMHQFIKSFEDVLLILDSSIKCRAMFETRIVSYLNLKPISIPNWTGIGAVRYIPDYLLDRTDEINDEFKNEINKLNTELIKNLQAQDSAFSLGQTSDGLFVVRFGMVNEVECLDKLALQVQQTGKSIEESEKFIERVAELIQQGIDKANEDLRKENERKIHEEGLLRQIPIVSGLINWWSPKQEVPIVGRTFHLKSGKIETTENIYKHHMQFQEDDTDENSIKESYN